MMIEMEICERRAVKVERRAGDADLFLSSSSLHLSPPSLNDQTGPHFSQMMLV